MPETKILCNVCQTESDFLDQAIVLGKYSVRYYACPNCGFIQTEEPYWLQEAYASAIANSDIGLIGRNIKLSIMCSALFPLFFRSANVFLDYGAGNGMFVRMMRDKGFEFYWQDKYSDNQFANGFGIEDQIQISILTAFEVFEHLLKPIDSISEMLKYSQTIVFSTRLLPRWRILPKDWWYFTPDTGQHISLYSRESLEFIARKFDLRLSSNGISFHVLSHKTVPGVVLKALSIPTIAPVISGIANIGRQSLLEDDYFRLTGRKLQ